MTLTSELRESRRDLPVSRGLKPLPKPVLQRVEVDEPGMSGKQLMLVSTVLGFVARRAERFNRRALAPL